MIRAKVQSTFIGRHFTAGEHGYCSWNEERHSKRYLDDMSQQVDTDIIP